jgi:hypothetical protein
MNARRIPRTAVENSLRLVRVPLDAAIGRLPGNGTGARPTARLALDRADATPRAFAGTILGDSVLREDAQQRCAALNERERAQALRGDAQEKTLQADARLEERHDQVARQRAQAELRAKSRRDEADRKREEKTRRAGELERQRLAASNNAAGRAPGGGGRARCTFKSSIRGRESEFRCGGGCSRERARVRRAPSPGALALNPTGVKLSNLNRQYGVNSQPAFTPMASTDLDHADGGTHRSAAARPSHHGCPFAPFGCPRGGSGPAPRQARGRASDERR